MCEQESQHHRSPAAAQGETSHSLVTICHQTVRHLPSWRASDPLPTTPNGCTQAAAIHPFSGNVLDRFPLRHRRGRFACLEVGNCRTLRELVVLIVCDICQNRVFRTPFVMSAQAALSRSDSRRISPAYQRRVGHTTAISPVGTAAVRHRKGISAVTTGLTHGRHILPGLDIFWNALYRTLYRTLYPVEVGFSPRFSTKNIL